LIFFLPFFIFLLIQII